MELAHENMANYTDANLQNYFFSKSYFRHTVHAPVLTESLLTTCREGPALTLPKEEHLRRDKQIQKQKNFEWGRLDLSIKSWK